MNVEIKVPSPGESITQVQLAKWLVTDGDIVEKDKDVAEIDSDKATLSVSAVESGKITFMVKEGETIEVGTVIATIDTSYQPEPTKPVPLQEKSTISKKITGEVSSDPAGSYSITPLAQKIMEERNISQEEMVSFIESRKIRRKDVENYHIPSVVQSVSTVEASGNSRETERKKLSALRLKLSERLVAVKNETAMLTTFNEVNMTKVLEIRKQNQDKFKEKFGVSLGLMSFFTKAVTQALELYPNVNAALDGDEVIFHHYADIGIAVSAPKGLMVPVLRNAESMTLAVIEQSIGNLATKARDGRLTLDEMKGGTFTITNGGVFGSMMSTPILNPPQSAILGLHKIMERPVAESGNVVIRPMMYLALSYDHRLIDGRDSVGFLVKVKEIIENPVMMLFGGKDPVQELIGL